MKINLKHYYPLNSNLFSLQFEHELLNLYTTLVLFCSNKNFMKKYLENDISSSLLSHIFTILVYPILITKILHTKQKQYW